PAQALRLALLALLVLLTVLALAGLRGTVTAPRWNGPLRGDGVTGPTRAARWKSEPVITGSDFQRCGWLRAAGSL
ncbi:MAG: hypothetical protein JO242_10445, partial [Streptosporangiaceae bacterium]|nr:hypothetical protein [Streptosporangiaceae bacterium]